jgi:ubiquinone/menaquinone biosynthesis C-methylase UbiE
MTTRLDPAEPQPHLIPSWLVPFLTLPMRKWFDPPERLVGLLIKPGMRILEIGPGSGFFTVPIAQATGPQGSVACVELQEPVLRRLRAKVRRKALPWVEARACTAQDLQVEHLEGTMDLAVAIDVLHEMPEPARAIQQMFRCLRPGGRLLVLEPKGHCSQTRFKAEVQWAQEAGFFTLEGLLSIPSRRHGVLFEHP